LPGALLALLDEVGERTRQLADLGQARLIECVEPALATLISRQAPEYPMSPLRPPLVAVAWMLEHVRPLTEALDWLAGDPGQISAHAQTGRNIFATLDEQAVDLDSGMRSDTVDWVGDAADAYRTWSGQQRDAVGAPGDRIRDDGRDYRGCRDARCRRTDDGPGRHRRPRIPPDLVRPPN
jgi:hypothetical protein